MNVVSGSTDPEVSPHSWYRLCRIWCLFCEMVFSHLFPLCPALIAQRFNLVYMLFGLRDSMFLRMNSSILWHYGQVTRISDGVVLLRQHSLVWGLPSALSRKNSVSVTVAFEGLDKNESKCLAPVYAR